MIILGIVDIYVVLFVNSFETLNNFRILSINIFLIHNYLASSNSIFQGCISFACRRVFLIYVTLYT